MRFHRVVDRLMPCTAMTNNRAPATNPRMPCSASRRVHSVWAFASTSYAVAVFARSVFATPTPTPTAQDVVEVCHHPCPDLIKFGKNGRLDSLLIRSTFPPGTVLDPAHETFEIELSNPDGVIYDAVLQAGDLVRKKTFFLFLDPTAKKTGGFRQGLAKVQLWDAQADGGIRVLIQAYGDLSAADRPEMTIRITVGDDAIGRTDTWQRTAIGWSFQSVTV